MNSASSATRIRLLVHTTLISIVSRRRWRCIDLNRLVESPRGLNDVIVDTGDIGVEGYRGYELRVRDLLRPIWRNRLCVPAAFVSICTFVDGNFDSAC